MKPLTSFPSNKIAHYLTQNPATLMHHVFVRGANGKSEEAGVGITIAEAYTKADAYVAQHHKGKTL